MTILDGGTSAPSVDPASTSRRRDTLDASIERELRRGDAMGPTLHPALWGILSTLVERELQQPTPTTEDSLLAATPIAGPFRTMRFQRRLDLIIRLGLARRDRLTLRPTIAGMAAVRPFSSMPGAHRPPRDKLRELRSGEIGTF